MGLDQVTTQDVQIRQVGDLRPETDEAYLARRVGGPVKDLVSFPRYFEIETVNACNARCPMCTISDWQRQPQVMRREVWDKIASELAQHAHEVKRVSLYRDGEPLLDKWLTPKVDQLKRSGIKSVSISTNAELLTPGRSDGLLAAGIDEIILSIDSLHKETYEKIRVGLDFHKVLQNATALFKERDWFGSPCSIRVRMIRQDLNREEWDSGSFQAHWKPFLRKQDTVEFRDIHNWGGQLGGFNIPAHDTQRPCIALWSLMVIFADGTVPLCNVDYNAKYPLGDVRDNTIAELWQSHTQNRRRQNHLDHQRGIIPLCANCTVWSEGSKGEL